MLHGHGDDWYKYSQTVRYNFSSNVWYEGPAQSLVEVISSSLPTIGRYPSPEAAELSEVAASFHKLSKESCLFTNGATEAFYLIAQLFRNQSATIFSPTFSEYEDACHNHDIKTSFINRSKFGAAAINTSLAFICNPNNPDGFISPLEVIESQIKQYPKTTFVLDEAYIDFASGAKSCISLLDKYPNMIIIKSLTKLFSIPGIRLGYILSSPGQIERLKGIKMPWSVNSLAIEMGKHIFRHYEGLKPDLKLAFKASKKLQQQISEMEGFSVIPAPTTFFLLKHKEARAADIKDYLMERYQILVRDASNFTGLEGEYIRIAVQSPEGNELLLKALENWSRK